MKIWVTGASGFVGRYVVDAVVAAGDEPLATDIRPDAERRVEALDIADAASTTAYARRTRPDACVHLAGLAFVPDSAKDPALATRINLGGAVNVAEALLAANPAARMVFASTAQVYGPRRGDVPLAVSDELRPASPYASIKSQAEEALRRLHRERGLAVCIARPGNHTGPGQSPRFVVPSFIGSVLDFRDGRADRVPVGNLESVRDFTDVRDVADAYLLLLRSGKAGETYNISSNEHVTINELLQKIAALAGVAVTPVVEPARYRPTDATPVLDTAPLRALGWQPRRKLDETLRDMLAACGPRHPAGRT